MHNKHHFKIEGYTEVLSPTLMAARLSSGAVCSKQRERERDREREREMGTASVEQRLAAPGATIFFNATKADLGDLRVLVFRFEGLRICIEDFGCGFRLS